ncbi:MAG: hypothetical protein ACKO2V_19765 [Snowella sp.]
MAEEIAHLCLETIEIHRQKEIKSNISSLLWQELRKEQIKLEKLNHHQTNQELSYLQKITILQDESVSLKAELELANSEIEAMKTSKFWKIRSLWFRVKEAIKLFL